MQRPVFPAAPPAPPLVRAAPGAAAALLLPEPVGTPPFHYQWSRAGASLDDRFSSSEDAGGVRLTITAARTGDSGVYTLQASNAAGKDTARVRLEVAEDEAPIGDNPPSFLRRLQDLTVKVGTRTRFLVEIVSSTECKVTWYRNERRLLEAERVSLARDGSFWCADLSAVSVDDAGRWTCTAENAGGRASCSAHLNVLVPKAYKRPEFVEELRALLTEQGTVSLECKVVGVPTPVLRWFKDSREIKAGDVFALTANAEDPTSLGTYTCEAVNCMGRAYSSSKVHVVGRGSREPSRPPSGLSAEPPPIFTKELEDQVVRVTEHLTLSCQVVVPPWPRSVVWYNKEGKIEPGEKYHVLEDGVGGYLMEAASAEWPDEGEWKCVATSAGGRVGISTCHVTMDVPKNYRKPRFMENLQAVLTEEGLVSFECKVVGFPTPVLSWFKDGQELKPGDVYQLTGTNSLGSYCCIARNCMGQASSSAELTVEDIQNQLNEEEKLQLFAKNQAPKFLLGLKSVEAKIDEPFRFTVKVAIPPEPSVLWYRDDQPVDESSRCHLSKEDKGAFSLDIQNLEFLDQAEWKCVAMNDFGHSVTSCFLKLVIPRHYKKPRFLENLQAILSDEGAVNLECKVIGVPQPVLKWYKDGEELKPGDIHRIISGQDGTCCLGTYTCEAQNCMGIAASSASLLGLEDSMKAKSKRAAEEQALERNLSLSTIHEERTSQMYDTPVGDITLDEKGEISFSFDGKEVSVSLYETPDLTEEEALQIVEMYADQLSENVTEHNVVELPPLRFVKETSTSGNLLMEAIIIDVSPDYFVTPEEDLRTEADVEDLSIVDENAPPQLSLDQDIEIGAEDYLEKTMCLLSDEKADLPAKPMRKKSDSQRSGDDYFSLSRDQTLSEEKKDDDTQVISETDIQSFASARSSTKQKSKISKPSDEGQDSSDIIKTVVHKEELALESEAVLGAAVAAGRPRRERRSSRGSRRSSSASEKSFSKISAEIFALDQAKETPVLSSALSELEFSTRLTQISTTLTTVINDLQIIEREIILKSELMSSAATASRSLELIGGLITPLSELHSISEATKGAAAEPAEVRSTLLNNVPHSLKLIQHSCTMIEKCIEIERDTKTLVKKTCVAIIDACSANLQKIMTDVNTLAKHYEPRLEERALNEIDLISSEVVTVLRLATDTIKTKDLLTEAKEIKTEEPTLETSHLRQTQKAVFELRSPLNSLLCIAENAESGKLTEVPKVKSSDVILNDMSASIQDLQTALEQIENLSVKESATDLNKYNTMLIETVMDPVLKLRTSFEQLSSEAEREEDKEILKQAIVSIKQNLFKISTHIQSIENRVGTFDILHSDNKLEVLQRMAQILIALENNLSNLETMPEIRSHMTSFHKNLTRVLENVIEGNESKKYFVLMEICDVVNRVNTSLKTLDLNVLLSLASLSNTMKIIRDHFISNIFESELNCAILNNIADILVAFQEVINNPEEISLLIESEKVQEIPTPDFEESKTKQILEHIEHFIASVSEVKLIETTTNFKSPIAPALERICPVLEELRRYVASSQANEVIEDESIQDIESDASKADTLAIPLCELNQNIIVLNHNIEENLESLKEDTTVAASLAKPLQDLYSALEVLQQDIVSQYGDLTPFEVSVNIASAVKNLQSCMVLIQEQTGVEATEDMSTLEDVSGIKTTAEVISVEPMAVPAGEETAVEPSVSFFEYEQPPTTTVDVLNALNEHVAILQQPDVVDALDSLSEVSDFSSLKSIAPELNELHTALEEYLHPLVMESSHEQQSSPNTTRLLAIAKPMQDIHNCLSVLDINNMPLYENILDMPPEKMDAVFRDIHNFKDRLEHCIHVIYSSIETTDQTVEISSKVEKLRSVCENMKNILSVQTLEFVENSAQEEAIKKLETVINNILNVSDVSKGIDVDSLKRVTEEVYGNISAVQEELLKFASATPETVAQEAILIDAIDKVEQSIAVLEEYDFVDLSKASDLASGASMQMATEMETEKLVQMDAVVENIVSVLIDPARKQPSADMIKVEDFMNCCKNELTIMKCILSKQLSHKKIIRLLQEFMSLQLYIKEFKVESNELNLSDEVKEKIGYFTSEADSYLKDVENTLVSAIHFQWDVLCLQPLTKIDNTVHNLQGVIKFNETDNEFCNSVCKILNEVMCMSDSARVCCQDLEMLIIEDITNFSHEPRLQENNLKEKLERLESILKQEISTITDEKYKHVLQELNECINLHSDYKKSTGTGRTLIILKCLAECSDIIEQSITSGQIIAAEDLSKEMSTKENTLKTLLSEIIAPLQTFQNQLKEVQEVDIKADTDLTKLDLSSSQSCMEVLQGIHNEISQIEQKVESEELENVEVIDNEDVYNLMNIDKEIHNIKQTIDAIENSFVVDKVTEVARPIAEIEKTLHNLMASGAVQIKMKEIVNSDLNSNVGSLESALERFIAMKADVLDASNVIGCPALGNGLKLAAELDTLLKNPDMTNEILEMKNNKIHLLKAILSKLDWQNLESYSEEKDKTESEKLKRVFLSAYQLLSELKTELNQALNFNKENAVSILQDIESNLSKETIDTVEELNSVLQLKELEQSVVIARELRENVATMSSEIAASADSDIMGALVVQAQLVKELKNALIESQTIIMENVDTLNAVPESIEQAVNITTQLQESLSAIATAQNILLKPQIIEPEEKQDIIDLKEEVLDSTLAAPEQTDTGSNVVTAESQPSEETEVPDMQKTIETAEREKETDIEKVADEPSLDQEEDAIVTDIVVPTLAEMVPVDVQKVLSAAKVIEDVSFEAVVEQSAKPQEPSEQQVSYEPPTITVEVPDSEKIADSLLHYITQYTSKEVGQAVEELSVLMEVEAYRQAVDFARELQQAFSLCETTSFELTGTPHSESLAMKLQNLHNALSVVETEILQNANVANASSDTIEKVEKCTTQLRIAAKTALGLMSSIPAETQDLITKIETQQVLVATEPKTHSEISEAAVESLVTVEVDRPASEFTEEYTANQNAMNLDTELDLKMKGQTSPDNTTNESEETQVSLNAFGISMPDKDKCHENEFAESGLDTNNEVAMLEQTASDIEYKLLYLDEPHTIQEEMHEVKLEESLVSADALVISIVDKSLDKELDIINDQTIYPEIQNNDDTPEYHAVIAETNIIDGIQTGISEQQGAANFCKENMETLKAATIDEQIVCEATSEIKNLEPPLLEKTLVMLVEDLTESEVGVVSVSSVNDPIKSTQAGEKTTDSENINISSDTYVETDNIKNRTDFKELQLPEKTAEPNGSHKSVIEPVHDNTNDEKDVMKQEAKHIEEVIKLQPVGLSVTGDAQSVLETKIEVTKVDEQVINLESQELQSMDAPLVTEAKANIVSEKDLLLKTSNEEFCVYEEVQHVNELSAKDSEIVQPFSDKITNVSIAYNSIEEKIDVEPVVDTTLEVSRVNDQVKSLEADESTKNIELENTFATLEHSLVEAVSEDQQNIYQEPKDLPKTVDLYAVEGSATVEDLEAIIITKPEVSDIKEAILPDNKCLNTELQTSAEASAEIKSVMLSILDDTEIEARNQGKPKQSKSVLETDIENVAANSESKAKEIVTLLEAEALEKSLSLPGEELYEIKVESVTVLEDLTAINKSDILEENAVVPSDESYALETTQQVLVEEVISISDTEQDKKEIQLASELVMEDKGRTEIEQRPEITEDFNGVDNEKEVAASATSFAVQISQQVSVEEVCSIPETEQAKTEAYIVAELAKSEKDNIQIEQQVNTMECKEDVTEEKSFASIDLSLAVKLAQQISVEEFPSISEEGKKAANDAVGLVVEEKCISEIEQKVKTTVDEGDVHRSSAVEMAQQVTVEEVSQLSISEGEQDKKEAHIAPKIDVKEKDTDAIEQQVQLTDKKGDANKEIDVAAADISSAVELSQQVAVEEICSITEAAQAKTEAHITPELLLETENKAEILEDNAGIAQEIAFDLSSAKEMVQQDINQEVCIISDAEQAEKESQIAPKMVLAEKDRAEIVQQVKTAEDKVDLQAEKADSILDLSSSVKVAQQDTVEQVCKSLDCGEAKNESLISAERIVEKTATAKIEQQEVITKDKAEINEEKAMSAPDLFCGVEKEQDVLVEEVCSITEAEQAKQEARIAPELIVVEISRAEIEQQVKITEDTSISTSKKEKNNQVLQNIEVFTSDDISETVKELAEIINVDEIKETLNVALELREHINSIESQTNVLESTDLVVVDTYNSEVLNLELKLQDALSVLQANVLDNIQNIEEITDAEKLRKVIDVVTHLQEDLAMAIVSQESVQIQAVPKDGEDEQEVNSMKQLESLLQEVSDKIDLSSSTRTVEGDEDLRDTLDEVQTVIIKLRRDYDGVENEAVNEILEDLECSVRSVQLQIIENSPPELLKEACATLSLLVNNMTETPVTELTVKEVNKTEKMLESCSDETQDTVDLIDIAVSIDTKADSKLDLIVSTLRNLKDTMSSLRLSFLGNSESVIEKGIDLNVSLQEVEDQVYYLEKEISSENNITLETRESILTAIHSVFGSISNMRGTITSIQKQYLYDNFGKPSEKVLKSIKNLTAISKYQENDDEKSKWHSICESLRKVMTNFEDIKFYVNLDKTARLPGESAFTKKILDELKTNISQVAAAESSEPDIADHFENAVRSLESISSNIDCRQTLEVKEKIPIYSGIASQIFELSDCILSFLKSQPSGDTVLHTKPLELPLAPSDDIVLHTQVEKEPQVVTDEKSTTTDHDENTPEAREREEQPSTSGVKLNEKDDRIEIEKDVLEIETLKPKYTEEYALAVESLEQKISEDQFTEGDQQDDVVQSLSEQKAAQELEVPELELEEQVPKEPENQAKQPTLKDEEAGPSRIQDSHSQDKEKEKIETFEVNFEEEVEISQSQHSKVPEKDEVSEAQGDKRTNLQAEASEIQAETSVTQEVPSDESEHEKRQLDAALEKPRDEAVVPTEIEHLEKFELEKETRFTDENQIKEADQATGEEEEVRPEEKFENNKESKIIVHANLQEEAGTSKFVEDSEIMESERIPEKKGTEAKSKPEILHEMNLSEEEIKQQADVKRLQEEMEKEEAEKKQQQQSEEEFEKKELDEVSEFEQLEKKQRAEEGQFTRKEDETRLQEEAERKLKEEEQLLEEEAEKQISEEEKRLKETEALLKEQRLSEEVEKKTCEEEEQRLKVESERKQNEEEQRLKEEVEKKKREVEEIKLKEETERKEEEQRLKEDAEKKKREVEEIKLKEETERKEEEQRLKEEAEKKKREENEQRLKEESERKQKEEEQRVKEEAEIKKREEEENRLKEETERKQIEEEQRLKEEAEKKTREENEQRLKEESERKQKEEEQRLKEEAEKRKREEEETKLKEETKRKQKEEQQRLKEELEKKKREEDEIKLKEENERKQKEEEQRFKEEAVKKKREEEEIKLKEETERKQKEEEQRLKEEAEKKKREEEELKLKEETVRKQKEEEQRLKAEAEKKKREEEELKLKEETVRKQKEEEQRLKAEAEKKKREEEEIKLKEETERKQKEEEQRLMAEAEKTKRKEEEIKLKEETERKQKEEEQRLKEEAEKKKREEEELKLKEETERKQKEEEQRLTAEAEKTKREEEEIKLKEETKRKQKVEEQRLKEEAEKKKREKEEIKLKEETERKQKEEEQRLKEEVEEKKREEERKSLKEETERKQKEEEQRLKEEEEKKKREEEENRFKKETEIKQKKEKKRLKDEAEKKKREEEEMRSKKETERIQNEEEKRLQDEAEKKRNEEEEMRLKEETERKQKEEEQRLKEVAEKKKREEEEKRLKEETEKIQRDEEQRLKEEDENNKLEEEAETKPLEEEKRLKEETVLKQREEEQRAKEEAEAVAKKLDEETRLKEESEKKQKEEQKRLKKEAEKNILEEKKKRKEAAKKIMLAEEKRIKEEAENNRKKEEIKLKEEEDAKRVEELKRLGEAKKKHQEEEQLRLKRIKEVKSFEIEEENRRKAEKDTKKLKEVDNIQKQELDSKQKQVENTSKEEAARKQIENEIFDKEKRRKKEAETTRPDETEKRARKKSIEEEKCLEGEYKLKEQTQRLLDNFVDQKQKEDGKIKLEDSKKRIESIKKKTEKNDEKHSTKLSKSIKDQRQALEPLPSPIYPEKYESEIQQRERLGHNEKPTFTDRTHRDYTMEFARPSNYREKTIEVTEVPRPDISYSRGGPTIYKAESILHEAQLRSSLPPPTITKRSYDIDVASETEKPVRQRTKAQSEARTVPADKRSSMPRDLRRKPVFSTHLTDRTAVEGSRVKLTCSVLCATDTKITWFKNGVLMDNKLKFRTKFSDGLITLEVLNAVPADSAEYSCVVENENGSVSSSATLKVYPSFEATPIPPTFTRSIRDTYHIAENELVLECRIRGQPLPTITWLKDNKAIESNDHYQSFYLADGVCRLAISHPTPEDSGNYTCKAENMMWSDSISHVVSFTGKESRCLSPNLTTIEKSRFSRQAHEYRKPHFANVLNDHTVVSGGTIGLQVEIRGAPTRVEWLREGRSVTDTYRNARTFVEQGLYTLALTDVTETESGTYTCRAWSTHGAVDMHAAVTVVPAAAAAGKPANIAGRPEKDVLISVGEDLNISFRVHGDPKPKVIFMKGTRDITTSPRVCKMTSDDYVKFTLKRSVVSDAGTYCILARNAYGCDRAFVTVVVRQRASSENLVSDWTYPDESSFTIADRNHKAAPERIPRAPSVADSGANWVSLAWPKPECDARAAPVLAYRVESWQLGAGGGARWLDAGITPLNSFDVYNLKQGEQYHFRVTPKNRYGWGESVQSTVPIGVGTGGTQPEFVEILSGQLKVLVGETASLSCVVSGKPTPEVVWMKNGHEVEEERGRVSASFDGRRCSLTIRALQPEDEARYSCEAANAHGRASTYARLAVVADRAVWEADAKLKRERSADLGGEYPPQFTMRLRDRRVQATYPVRLTCQVVGAPPPALTWYRDGQELRPDDRHSMCVDEHFHTLEIAATRLEDGGEYEAVARNARGAVGCRCCLVVDKGIRAYVAPDFCLGLDPLYRVHEGEELRVSAVVEAYPSVGVTWYRDGVRLRPSRRAVMTLDRDGGAELAIAGISPRDAGVYTCTANNEVGSATTSARVEVIAGDCAPSPKRQTPVVLSPDVPYSKEPMFIKKPRSSEAREGDTVIIQCEVVGDPKPDVYWLRDFLKPDYYRDASHFRRVGDGPEYRIEIPHARLDYTGAYSVVAKNAHGEIKAIISLQILARDTDSAADTHNVKYGRVDVMPRFRRELTDLLCCDGDDVEFQCEVDGDPDPDVKWFRHGELIRESHDFEVVREGGAARLRVLRVAPEDEGVYACEAANSLGKTTCAACLVVYPPGEPNTLSQQLRRPPALSTLSTPRSTPRATPARSLSATPGPEPRRHYSPSRQVAPKFYTYPHNKVVEEGGSVRFQCAVAGHPAPWASWDKEGVLVTPSARLTVRERDDMRILEIDEVTIEDAGLYRITLENDYGRVEAAARLDVISHKGKFYGGVRAYSASPRRAAPFRRHAAPAPAPAPARSDLARAADYRRDSPGVSKWADYACDDDKDYDEVSEFGEHEINIFFTENYTEPDVHSHKVYDRCEYEDDEERKGCEDWSRLKGEPEPRPPHSRYACGELLQRLLRDVYFNQIEDDSKQTSGLHCDRETAVLRVSN